MAHNTVRNALLSLTLLGAASVAQAQVYGTLGFVPIGSVTANNPDLSLATSVTVPSTEIVNNIPAQYNTVLGIPNDFYTGGADPVTSGEQVSLSETTISDGSSLNLSFMTSSGQLNFTATGPVMFLGSTDANGRYTRFAEIGLVTGGSIVGSQLADVAGNFNQSAIGTAVDGAFTFSTPPNVAPTVPEPGSVAMLVGMGVTGLGFVARRRRR